MWHIICNAWLSQYFPTNNPFLFCINHGKFLNASYKFIICMLGQCFMTEIVKNLKCGGILVLIHYLNNGFSERWLLLCVVGITAIADELGTVELYLGFTRQYYMQLLTDK